MANSSDWIAALASSAGRKPVEPQEWIAALMEPAGFVEGLPEMRPAHAPVVEHEPEKVFEPDPIAEAFARGEAQGRAAAAAEFEAEQQHHKALRLSFRAFDSAAIDSLAGELAETVIALCGQVLQDYEPDSEAMRLRCRKAAKRLGASVADHTLKLHPLDIELVSAETSESWSIEADDTIARGGLRFEGPDGTVSDGPAEWRRAIAAAIRG